MQAVVLAGQRDRGRLPHKGACGYESEILVAGRPMASYVLDALAGSKRVDRVVLVGPESLGRPGVDLAPVTGDLFGNVLSGLAMVEPSDEGVLVVTGDVPLLTGELVDTFLAMAPSGYDVVYPVIPKSVTLRRFPDTRRTFVRFREGEFTGGNIFLVNPQAMPGLRHTAERLLAHRKSPVQLARDIGLGVLLRLAVGRLSLTAVERKAADVLGISGCALIFPHPEVGVDVDKAQDLTLVERELRQGEASGENSRRRGGGL